MFVSWFLAIAGMAIRISYPLMALLSCGYLSGLITAPFVGILCWGGTAAIQTEPGNLLYGSKIESFTHPGGINFSDIYKTRSTGLMLQESLDLNTTLYSLTDEQVAFYQKNRYIKLKNVFSAAELKYFGDQITRKVFELNTMHVPMAERDTYSKAFLQIVNLWTQDEIVRELVFSKRLAKIAADLMEVDGVRLYHDQALYKEPSGGFTPWHADQFYWPLATDRTITAWIPLQPTPLAMGPLEFSAASHSLTEGHDLKISDDSEQEIDSLLANRDFDHVVEPFDLGEVSFHSGWLYHRAGPNSTTDPRRVMCVIYMDEDMTLKMPDNDDQQRDWDAWCPEAQPGEKIQTPLNPILWSR